MCSDTYRYKTSPVPSASHVQRFGTPWTLKALHPASCCPASSAGGYFYHTVAVSYWAHSTGASQRHNRLAPTIPSYSSPQWKIQATLCRVLRVPLSSPNGTKLPRKSAHPDKLLQSQPQLQAPPGYQGRADKWKAMVDRGTRSRALIIIYIWPLKTTCG